MQEGVKQEHMNIDKNTKNINKKKSENDEYHDKGKYRNDESKYKSRLKDEKEEKTDNNG